MKDQGNGPPRRSISRRRFLRLGGAGFAGAAFLGAAGCGSGGGQGGGARPVVFVSLGGDYQEAQEKAWINPYQKEKGAEVVVESPLDYAKLEAMVENNQVTWDVVGVGELYGNDNPGALFEPLDYSIIDRSGLAENLATEYRVAFILYATTLGYNSEKTDGKPGSWEDFFDLDTFPGKRGIASTANGSAYPLEIALLGDGVAPGELYPLDIDRALAKLDTIRDGLVFWETGAQSQQQLADGEVAMSAAWNGRVQSAKDAGAPVDIQWNQHMANTEFFVIPKGSQNVEAANKLISYCVSAQHNGDLASHIAYAPTNDKSVDDVKESVAPLLPTYQNRPEIAVYPDLQWWAENQDTAQKRYTEWQLG